MNDILWFSLYVLEWGNIKEFGNNLEEVSCIRNAWNFFFVKNTWKIMFCEKLHYRLTHVGYKLSYVVYRSTHVVYRLTYRNIFTTIGWHMHSIGRYVCCSIKACSFFFICRLLRSTYRKHIVVTGRCITLMGRRIDLTGIPI